jgi:hypothetical protein
LRRLFPLPPLPLARSRDACTPSRAPDAPTAAARQRALLRTHRDTLPPRTPQSPTRRALAQLVEPRRRVVGATGRSPNRLPRPLQTSCPPGLHGWQAKDTAIFCDCLRRWPPLTAVPRAHRATRTPFFRAHHGRSAAGIAPRLQALTAAPPRTTDAGVLAPQARLGQALVAQLRVPWQASADGATASAPRAPRPPAVPLGQALPGAGPVFAPRRLVAFGAPRDRSTAAAALPQEAGSAPGTARSGTQSWVPWRRQGPTGVRPPVVAWAAASRRPAFGAGVFSQPQRDRGTAHQAAVRALACPWLRLRSRCWQERTPYDASTSLQARNKRGASLLQNRVHPS